MEANVYQIATTGTRGSVSTGFIPAKWIMRFRDLACLYDTEGKIFNPAELYMRNPETEPFFGIEPFVKAELDNEITKPLLRLLGVREKQTDVTKVIDRLRSLSRVPINERLLQEVLKWYSVLEKIVFHADKNTLTNLNEIFKNEQLIYSSGGNWEASSDVFIFESEEYPEAPTVYPSTQDYLLWNKLGVINHPTEDLIISWLSELPANEILESNIKNRIIAALRRFPEKIWNECGHWLALNNTWQPIESFSYRLTMQSLTKYADLFPHIKSRCADFQMLKSDLIESDPFELLSDLVSKIEYKLTREPNNFKDYTQKPKWLSTLGKYLQRIKLNDEIKKKTLLENAVRLEKSFWKIFYQSDSIEVTPYIDNTPAGLAQKRNFIWHEYHIFIKEGSIAKSIRDIAEELARPFSGSIGIEILKDTFLVCIDRPIDFVKEYMEENFTIEEESVLIPEPSNKIDIEEEENKLEEIENEVSNDEPDGSDKSDTDNQTHESDQPIESEDEIVEEDEDEEPNKKKSRKEPTLFERFATSRGFYWNSDKNRFINQDGSWIERSHSPLHWQYRNPALQKQYWVQSHSLSDGGIEIPAEVWNYLEYNPGLISLILIDEAGNPKEFKANSLLSWKMSKKIEILPSKYIIRLGNNN